MNVNSNKVIEKLLDEIARLNLEVAILKVQIDELTKPDTKVGDY